MTTEPKLEYCFCGDGTGDRINMIELGTIRKYLKGKKRRFNLYIRKRESSGRRGLAWPCGTFAGIGEFEALIKTDDFKSKIEIAMSFDTEPSSCELESSRVQRDIWRREV